MKLAPLDEVLNTDIFCEFGDIDVYCIPILTYKYALNLGESLPEMGKKVIFSI